MEQKACPDFETNHLNDWNMRLKDILVESGGALHWVKDVSRGVSEKNKEAHTDLSKRIDKLHVLHEKTVVKYGEGAPETQSVVKEISPLIKARAALEKSIIVRVTGKRSYKFVDISQINLIYSLNTFVGAEHTFDIGTNQVSIPLVSFVKRVARRGQTAGIRSSDLAFSVRLLPPSLTQTNPDRAGFSSISRIYDHFGIGSDTFRSQVLRKKFPSFSEALKTLDQLGNSGLNIKELYSGYVRNNLAIGVPFHPDWAVVLNGDGYEIIRKDQGVVGFVTDNHEVVIGEGYPFLLGTFSRANPTIPLIFEGE